MKRAILRAVIGLLAGAARAESAAGVAEAAMPGAMPVETWRAEWRNRLGGQRGEWVFAWTMTGAVLNGTVTVDGVAIPLEGKRDGAWLELGWTDAEGRVTQVRAVLGGGEWRGAVMSGGGGRLVEYGRVRATAAR